MKFEYEENLYYLIKPKSLKYSNKVF